MLRAAADAIESGTPYHAFREPFREMLGICPTSTADADLDLAALTTRVDALPGMAGLTPCLDMPLTPARVWQLMQPGP